ncbi:MAG: hypothetical protein R3E86_08155 [Pseudomonadales bacterium]
MKLFARTLMLVALTGMLASPAMAAPEDEPSALAMAGDLVIARPVGLVLTTLGAAAFVVSLPFSALGGNVEQAGQTLVVGPAKATFQRCLGCRTTGRYQKPD